MTSFTLTDQQRALRDNPAVQEAVTQIREAHSADEISAAVAATKRDYGGQHDPETGLTPKEVSDPTFTDYLSEVAFDYAMLDDGDISLGSPEDVAVAAASLIDDGWQPSSN